MPIKKKIIILEFILVVNFIGALLLMAFADVRLFWVGLGVVIVSAIILTRLRCPRCRKLVFRHTATFAGMTWQYGGGNPLPTYCSKCHFDFRTPMREA